MENNARLMSLDAFRGFDMFWIMGGEALVCAIAALFGYPDFRRSFGHVPWDGLQFMDTVFPTFLFMAGVSFPFSCAKSRARGLTDGAIALKCLRRFAILAILGVLGGLLSFKFSTMRVWSVLGRIGFGWMCAALLYLVFSLRTRLVLAALMLVAVVVGTMVLVAPDAATVVYSGSMKGLEQFGRGPFSPAGNFGCWLDRTLTAGHTYRPLFDPEGFAGMIPAVVTAMLGMFAGEIVRREGGATMRKALELFACGVACGLGGLALSSVCPINKALWSPSFVLTVGGCSFAAFSVFYLVIDVLHCSRWAFFFTVIGMNSITIYMAQQIVGFGKIRDFFFGGVASLCPPAWGAVVSAIGYVAVCWLFLWILYRKKMFLKV